MKRLLVLLLAAWLLVPAVARAEERELTIEDTAITYVDHGDRPRIWISAVNVTDVTVTVRRVSQLHSRVEAADRRAVLAGHQIIHLGRRTGPADFEYSQYVDLPVEQAGTYYYRIDGGGGHFAEGLLCVGSGVTPSPEAFQP